MSSCKVYTLDVPACKDAIRQLMDEIIEDAETQPTTPPTRVHLEFGTCRLLCRDEREREQHDDKVTAYEAVEVLLMSFVEM